MRIQGWTVFLSCPVFSIQAEIGKAASTTRPGRRLNVRRVRYSFLTTIGRWQSSQNKLAVSMTRRGPEQAFADPWGWLQEVLLRSLSAPRLEFPV